MTIDKVSTKSSTKGSFIIEDNKHNIINGEIDKWIIGDDYRLFITEIKGNVNDSFTLIKKSRLNAIKSLQNNLSISEDSIQNGILKLYFTGIDPEQNKLILGSINQNYLIQNIRRKSAEAEKSLNFLHEQLPRIKEELTVSEDNLNRYRLKNEAVNIALEAESKLKTIVKLESQLNETLFKESEISQRYTKDHPVYISLNEKRDVLFSEIKRLQDMIKKLPKTQQQILRLTRDVDVSQQIYLQVLNKIQELNVIKAGTIGNVRIIDSAESDDISIKPNKRLIIFYSFIFGLIISIIFALLKSMIQFGVVNPEDIEAIGLSVYGVVPFSRWQMDSKKRNRGKENLQLSDTILAVENPADISIEVLRSFRTSLHFTMLESKNNILMISGPSPEVGKSFIASNMGIVSAFSNKKVLLIDGDMRNGVIDKMFRCNNRLGLSDYLLGEASIETITKNTDFKNLNVITHGNYPSEPSEILMDPRLEYLLNLASKNYDLVIIDTPPILAVTDTAIIASHCGVNVLVARFGKTNLKEIEIIRNRFMQDNIVINGLILNGAYKMNQNNYNYYPYEYKNKSSN